MATIPEFPPKDPGESLLYTWDFTDLLGETEEITGINTVTIDRTTVPALVNEAQNIVTGNKKVSIVFSGGLACTPYLISVNVTTDEPSPNNIFERSCTLPVEDR